MGSGGYVLCELAAVRKEFPDFQKVFAELEREAILKCTGDWFASKVNKYAATGLSHEEALKAAANEVFGGLTPKSGEQFGRTTILPSLFDDHNGNQMVTWRQLFTTAGHQTLITGTRAGNTIPEDFKVAWIGLAFPNKNQHITEIKFQIGDTKYGRINLEDIHSYKVPAVIFEKGFIINEEESFDLYGYIEGPIPSEAPFITGLYQSIVMLGACYYRRIDRVLGNPGSAI